MLGYIFV